MGLQRDASRPLASRRRASATTYFKDWYNRVIHTKLEPMKTVATTIKERLANVVSYCTHGITNAVAEGMNSKIMSIKRRVGGYPKRRELQNRDLFLLRWTRDVHLGDNDTVPASDRLEGYRFRATFYGKSPELISEPIKFNKPPASSAPPWTTFAITSGRRGWNTCSPEADR